MTTNVPRALTRCSAPDAWRSQLATAARIICAAAWDDDADTVECLNRFVEDVTVLAPWARTPRTVMHECSASSTTPAPRARSRRPGTRRPAWSAAPEPAA